MPQPKFDAVHRYFMYDKLSNQTICQLCEIKLKGRHTSNLKTHLAVKHTNEYRVVMEFNKKKPKTNNRSITSAANTSESDIITKATMTATLEILKNLCVKLVAVHGRPISMIDDEAFQQIINLAMPSHTSSKLLNIKAIKAMIPQVASSIKEKISAEIKNKMISMKLDSITCLDRTFIGIGIQFIKNNEIVLRNIAVIELNKRPTSEQIKKIISETLNDMKISKEQLYCLCTDHEDSTFRAVKLISGQYDDSNDEEFIKQEDDWNNYGEDFGPIEENKSIEENQTNNQEDVFTSTPINIHNFIELDDDTHFPVRSIISVAYFLQLAIKDVIQDKKVHFTIELSRRIVKILLSPPIKNIIVEANLQKPMLDCPTKLISLYNMLYRLLTYRHICEAIPETVLIITNVFWDEVKELLVCLEPVNESMVTLQNEQLTLGDFYIAWLKCKSKVQSIHNNIATSLSAAMEVQEQRILENDVVIEALYLDPRVNVMLSPQQCEKARYLLRDTFHQIQRVREQSDDGKVNNSNEKPTTSAKNDMSELEQMLMRAESMRGTDTKLNNCLEASLYDLVNTPRIPLQENIIQYWNTKAIKSSELAILARIVLAAPANQATLERLFSLLKFILHPSRNNLSATFLRDLIIIRSNKEFLLQ